MVSIKSEKKIFDASSNPECVQNKTEQLPEKLDFPREKNVMLDIKDIQYKNVEYVLPYDLKIKINESLAKNNIMDKKTFYLSIFHFMLSRYTNQNFISVFDENLNRIDQSYDMNYDLKSLYVSIQEKLKSNLNDILQHFEHFLIPHAYFEYQNDYTVIKPKDICFFLKFYLKETDEMLKVNFAYVSEVFSEKILVGFVQNYFHCLEQFSIDPFQSLNEFDILSESEKEKVVSFSTGESKPIQVKLVHEEFERQVDLHPEKTALTFKNENISYENLNKTANKLAFQLQQLGIGPNVVVAIAMERSFELIITILAILKAGGTFLPLDVIETPLSRLENILNIAQAKMIIYSAAIKNDLFDFFNGILYQFNLNNFKSDHDGSNLQSAIDEESGCYCLFTSGSTGEPKGVLNVHRGLANFTEWFKKALELSPMDVLILKAPIVFDTSIQEIFCAVNSGARLVISIPNGHKDPIYLEKTIQDERVTVIDFVPSMLQAFLNYNSKLRLNSLRIVIAGGEALTHDLVKQFEQTSNAKLFNFYGPTEASVSVTYNDIFSNDNNFDNLHKYVPIGKPLFNTHVYIVDKFGNLVPIGVVGEIWIAGFSLAHSYINRSELTKDKFIFNPNYGRIYKTGDYGRYLENGMIEYICRIDHQIKLRGLRIEVSEIETAINSHNQVKQVLVTDFSDSLNNKQLAAYVVPNCQISDQKSFFDEIKKTISKQLPSYMIPSRLIVLENMPLNINGKIDKKMLPSPIDCAVHPVHQVAHSEVPKTEIELKLVEIWSSILNLSTIGVDDSFIEIGGSSINAIYLISEIVKVFSKRVLLEELLQNITIRKLAKLIASKQLENSEQSEIFKVDEEARFEPFPLSDIQQAYLLGRNSYFDIGSVTSYYYVEYLMKKLDIQRLNYAINRLIERHDMLRAVIDITGKQRIMANVPFYIIRVNNFGQYCIEEALNKMVEEERKRILKKGSNVAQWPNFHLEISVLPNEESCIHFWFDLMIIDGRSLEIFFNELFDIYENPDLKLADIHMSFRDYLVAMKNFENSPEFYQSRNYWLEKIMNLPDAPELPVNNLSTVGATFFNRSFKITKERWIYLKLKASEMNITPAVLLCTIYANVISMWSRSSKFTLNLMFFNRPPLHKHVNDVIGNFSSTTLLSIDLSEQKSFIEQAKKLQSQLWKDLEHSLFNGVKVLQEINRLNGGSSKASMPIIFAYGIFEEAVKRENTFRNNLNELYQKLETPHVWLDHQVYEDINGEISFSWDSLDELFPQNVLNEMFECYKSLVTNFNDWHKPVNSFLDNTQSTDTKNNNLLDLNIESNLINKGFIENVKLHKNKLALINADKTFTYQELYNVANELREQLDSMNIAFNTPIAIVMRKSWEEVAAVLGVHLFGSYYVPIDANLPLQRISQLIEISDAKAIITHANLASIFKKEFTIPILNVNEEAKNNSYEIFLNNRQSPFDLAYMIFTSGSTGVPKLVMIEHGSALNTILDVNKRFEVTPNDSVICLSALSFDLSVYDIYGLLNAGGFLVIPQFDEWRDPSSWKRLIDSYEVTIWNSVPQLMQIFIDNLRSKKLTTQAHLRVIMLSGDFIPVHLPDSIFSMFKDNFILASLGGATEASIWSNYYIIERLNEKRNSVPYGKALSNQVLTILSDTYNKKPTWATGMIYIGGKGLARGYLNDEEKTKRSFINHPLTNQRLYRTGDYGRFLPSGDIEILGREDNQVKIQGYRVELAEIEAVIAKFHLINSVSVQAIGTSSTTRHLVALLVAKNAKLSSNTALIENEIKEFISHMLPYYMIPHRYIFVDRIPISSNGKVDKKEITRLSEQSLSNEVDTKFEGELTETEKVIKSIWEKLLNLENINVNCNFFEIGGQSFIGFQMINEISKLFKIDFPISVLFQNCTIRNVSKIIDEDKLKPASNQSQPLVVLQNAIPDKYIFFIHPIGGNVFCYHELSKYFSSKASVIGIQSPGLTNRFPEDLTLETMATEYIKLIQSLQQTGPYFLAGWSFGGVIGYEIARQLKENLFETCYPVMLIDSPAPYLRDMPSDADILEWFNKDFDSVLTELNPSYKKTLLEVMKTNIKVLNKYFPYETNIPVVVLKAQTVSMKELKDHKYSNNADWGWSTVTNKIENILNLDGDHYSILNKEHVHKLADSLLNLNFI